LPNSQEQRDRPLPDRFRPRRRVLLIDRIAESVITLGGLGVIAAVLGIIAYLAWVVYPLTQPGHVEPAGEIAFGGASSIAMVDEYERIAAVAGPLGVLRVVSIQTGEVLNDTIELGPIEHASYSPGSGFVVMARPDASLDLGTLSYEAKVLRPSNLPEGVGDLVVGGIAPIEGGIIERTGEEQFRRITVGYEEMSRIEAPESASPVIALDSEEFGRDKVVAVIRADGSGSVMIVTTRRSLVGGNSSARVRTLPIELIKQENQPIGVVLLDSGSELVIVGADGRADRYARDGSAYVFAETTALTDEAQSVTVVTPLLGRNTILVGTDDGQVLTWMLTREGTDEGGSRSLVRVKEFRIADQPVTRISTSQRDRTFIAADAGGTIRLWHATSGKLVGEAQADASPRSVLISPKLDGFYAIGEQTMSGWHLKPGHPTVTMRSLFLSVWYEGDHEPSLVYQSTAADDAAEPKLSITPLIFGTLKATVFAMIFAVPIAVMAAIYSSEFLPRRLRSRVKPTVEMMASLPSVVLGFIAAMVLAPFVRDHLSAVLVGLVVVPVAILVAASVWPMLPGTLAWRLPQWVQLSFIALACVVGVLLSTAVGPAIDRALFSVTEAERAVLAGEVVPVEQAPAWTEGKTHFTLSERNRLRAEGLYIYDDEIVRPVDVPGEVPETSERSPFKVWLNGMIGSPMPGWVALLFVPSLAIAGMITMGAGRQSAAKWLPLARVVASVVLAIPIAMVLARLCVALGWDARESVLGTFTQRNTFVVGVIMGFAIIPIIFTLSDDAMQSVPNSLRSASLGTGATQWQTTIRIVLPVAASGIFSAIMIGLGRAAGETMIVLMATGNTPVMDWNIFGGLRTLSANIAVELPEADRGGTHYRVLFLCGVVLFAITFVVNTSAEIIRQHFRKRSAML
jgi:phosphate transport system permease protein